MPYVSRRSRSLGPARCRVGVAVPVGFGVAVGSVGRVGVSEGVGVLGAVTVGVGFWVAVAVGVEVCVGVAVWVGVEVAVGVLLLPPYDRLRELLDRHVLGRRLHERRPDVQRERGALRRSCCRRGR